MYLLFISECIWNFSVVFTCFPAAPTILHPMNNTIFLLEEGDSFICQCTAKGYPFPTVAWLESRRVEKFDEGIHIRDSGTFITLPSVTANLTLESIVSELSGTYTCIASNPDTAFMQVLQSDSVRIDVVVARKSCRGMVVYLSVIRC